MAHSALYAGQTAAHHCKESLLRVCCAACELPTLTQAGCCHRRHCCHSCVLPLPQLRLAEHPHVLAGHSEGLCKANTALIPSVKPTQTGCQHVVSNQPYLPVPICDVFRSMWHTMPPYTCCTTRLTWSCPVPVDRSRPCLCCAAASPCDSCHAWAPPCWAANLLPSTASCCCCLLHSEQLLKARLSS